MPFLEFDIYQVEPDKTENVVAGAHQIGYPSIENEERVSNAQERNWIPCEELFITTKLWIPGCRI